MEKRALNLHERMRRSLRTRRYVVVAVVLLAVLAPAGATALRSHGSPPTLLHADRLGRATPGGPVAASGNKAVVARRSRLDNPVVLSKPSELHLKKAHGAVFDVRTLKSTVVKRERPEHQAPGETEQGKSADRDASLPTSVDPSTLAAPSLNAPAPGPIANFDGLDFANWGAGHPPDTNGDVGPTYYIQTINSSIGIFDKSTGTRVAAFTFDSFMSQGNFGNQCDTSNFGDPVVLYDSFEDRWFITDFAFTLDASGSITPQHVFQCFAVSKTGDPVAGGWNFYSIEAPGGIDDYPKFGVWPDGIYMSANMFGYNTGAPFAGPHVWAIDKMQMYAGEPSVLVADFQAPPSDFTLLPSNARLQTGMPPLGTPDYFVSTWQFVNALTVYKFHVDWDKISTSTFTGPQVVINASAWPNAGVGNAVTPGNELDTLQVRAMAQLQYSNIGGSESLWATHTVRRENTTGFAAPRWYQLNVSGGTVAASTVQGTTWDPDAANIFYRFMPSLAVDRMGDMALGYSKSNSTTNPQIKYAGRLAGDPVNTFSQEEQTLIDGTGTQVGNCGSSTCIRWGDYSGMALDPDGCTFWETNEYYPVDGLDHHTRIGSFQFPGCSTVGGGTLSGTVTDAGSSDPIAGATVALGNRTTATDGNGNYSFSVPAGTYPSLTASKAGFDPSTSSSIVVPDGGTATRDLALSAAPKSGCFVDGTQSAFQRGIPSSCDLTSTPGAVTLGRNVFIDQQNTSIGSSGFSFNSTTWAGQTFTPAVTAPVTRVDLDLFCSGCTGTTPNITVSIRATSGSPAVPTGPDLATATIAGFNSGGAGFFSANFAGPATLTAGTRYAVVFRAASNPSAGTYAYVCSCTGLTGGTNPYANGQRVGSGNSGSTWAADTNVGGRDLGFKVWVDTGFPPSGTFVSSVKDANPAAGHSSTWTTLSFTATTPAGTDVKLQVAGSNNSYGPFSFVGPDGTASTFFTTSGASLSQFDGFRYLRYKAYLATGDNSVSPTLSDVAVCFHNVGMATSLALDPATGTYGGTTTLSATLAAGANGLSGKTIAFTLDGNAVGSATTDANGVATLSGVSLSGIDAGAYAAGVGASFAGDTDYEPSDASSSLTIAKANQEIDVTTHAPASAVYDTSFAVAAAGGGSGNPVTFSSDGVCTNLDATFSMTSGSGVCSVKYDQAGDDNYAAAPQVTESVDAQKADETITVTTHAPASAVYGTSFAVQANAPGGVVTFSSAGACSNSGNTFTMTSGTGTCSVVFEEAGNDNYNAAPEVTESVTAQKANQTITFDPLGDKTYGDPDFDPGATASSGLAVAYSTSGSCSTVSGKVHISGAGSCTVTAFQGGDANYDAATPVSQAFSIAEKPLTIAANDRSKLFGQTLTLGTKAFTTSGLVNGDGVAGVTLTSAGAAAEALGTYPIVPSAAIAAAGTDLGNYSIAYANGTLTVARTGVVGLESVTVNGMNALVDSFYSSAGPYGAGNKGAAVNVLGNGAIALGGAKVHGELRSTQASVTLKDGALVTGDVTAGTTIKNAGTINGTATPNSPSAPLAPAPVAECLPFSGGFGVSGKFTYNAIKGDLTVKGPATLADGTYCFHNVTLTGGGMLRVTGPVAIGLTGQLDVGGGSNLVNATSVPANLQISSSYVGGNGIDLSAINAYVSIYAPRTGITLAGGSAVFGSLLGRTLTVSGDSSVHYDVH
jgi:hypothetical protein